MTATDELRDGLTKRGVEWKAPASFDGTARYDTTAGGYWFHEFDGKITIHGLTPAQAIAATLGSDRLAFLEEKVRLQGDYITKLTKENNALFAQSCEAATRHAGQIDAMQRKLEAATLGARTCREVYLLMATDIGDGREEVLGVYATEEAAIAAINENQFGYALHHVRKLEVPS